MRNLIVVAMFLCSLAATLEARAQAYPAKPIRAFVPVSAGSTIDNLARIIAQELRTSTGAVLLIENRAGGGARIAPELVSKAPPDGYTILFCSSSTHSANPNLFKTLPYDPIKDFAPVLHLATMPYALVTRSALPIRSIQDLVAQAKASPGKLSYSYGAPATQIAGAAFNRIAGIDTLGVPYKSQPPAIADLLGGQLEYVIADLPILVPQVRSGALRALVQLSDRRSPLLPDVPTMAEAGLPGYDLSVWIGLVAPAGTPSAVIQFLSQNVASILTKPEVRAQMSNMGMEHSPNSPAEFDAFIKQQLGVWNRRVREAGIPLQSE